ncbi:MAG: hypothetical protein GXX96_09615 [Planctomycetaceae bacterium]|jgi:hypothetical protein|nr:hypothetical protein [Planctomycetaceae bacterium]
MAVQNPGLDECGFRPLELSEDGQAIIDVSASGRCGAWGTARTCDHPKFLVVEYRLQTLGRC